jgi:hypothetical protein
VATFPSNGWPTSTFFWSVGIRSTLIDIGVVKDAAWRRPRGSTTSEAKRVQDAMNESRLNHELEVLGLQWLSAGRASGYVRGEHLGKQ